MFKNIELVFIRLTLFSVLGFELFGFLFVIFGLLHLFAVVSSLLVLKLVSILFIFFLFYLVYFYIPIRCYLLNI